LKGGEGGPFDVNYWEMRHEEPGILKTKNFLTKGESQSWGLKENSKLDLQKTITRRKGGTGRPQRTRAVSLGLGVG